MNKLYKQIVIFVGLIVLGSTYSYAMNDKFLVTISDEESAKLYESLKENEEFKDLFITDQELVPAIIAVGVDDLELFKLQQQRDALKNKFCELIKSSERRKIHSMDSKQQQWERRRLNQRRSQAVPTRVKALKISKFMNAIPEVAKQ